jgi:hypothetical protein
MTGEEASRKMQLVPSYDNMIQRRFGLTLLLFADDQVIISNTADNLPKVAHKLSQIITEYGLTISVQKTKSTAFKGRDPIRSKIVITKS